MVACAISLLLEDSDHCCGGTHPPSSISGTRFWSPRVLNGRELQAGIFEDLFDAGNDVRLDVAYPDFYREQAIGNAQLPSPLDTQTLFSNLARQLIDDHSRVKSRPDMKGQDVHQLVQLVQGGLPSHMMMMCMISVFPAYIATSHHEV